MINVKFGLTTIMMLLPSGNKIHTDLVKEQFK